MLKRRTGPVAMWIGAQASSGGGPSYSVALRLSRLPSLSEVRWHWAISDSSIWERGFGRTVRCFRSPFLISQRSSQGRKFRRLTERLSSWSFVSLRMAGGISVSLLLRRLSTRIESSSNSSPDTALSPFPARKSRRKGCNELYTSSLIGGSLIDGSFVRCCRGRNRPCGTTRRFPLLSPVSVSPPKINPTGGKKNYLRSILSNPLSKQSFTTALAI